MIINVSLLNTPNNMGPNKATNRNPVISTLILMILTIIIQKLHKLTLTFELRI